MRAYLQLVRLPNVFTAIADVFMGYLVTRGELSGWPIFALLVSASASLYTAGMVLNDVFDFEVDARERPERPLVSGRIGRSRAAWLGGGLLAAGVGLGWLAGGLAGQVRSGLVASLLAVAVLAYDGPLKRTAAAPLLMGACRLLNVLLGASSVQGELHAMHWMAAAAVGVYIVGVTWFARTEARLSSRWRLALGSVVIVAGLVMAARYPSWATPDMPLAQWPVLATEPEAIARWARGDETMLVLNDRWYLFWWLIGLVIGWRCLRALIDPQSGAVQAAVKHCILSLIIIDAAMCAAVAGPLSAMMVLLLLPPAMFLGRWIYST